MTLQMCRRTVIYRHKRKFTVRLNWADTGYWKTGAYQQGHGEPQSRDAEIPQWEWGEEETKEDEKETIVTSFRYAGKEDVYAPN